MESVFGIEKCGFRTIGLSTVAECVLNNWLHSEKCCVVIEKTARESTGVPCLKLDELIRLSTRFLQPNARLTPYRVALIKDAVSDLGEASCLGLVVQKIG